jgi:hypothetical protein
MRNIALILLAITLMSMASAIELSNTNVSKNLFASFMQEDLVTPVPESQPVSAAWNASQDKVVGAFDYSEVSDLTNAFGIGNSLVRVGNLSNGDGHYMDGTKQYIQP